MRESVQGEMVGVGHGNWGWEFVVNEKMALELISLLRIQKQSVWQQEKGENLYACEMLILGQS